MAVVRFEGLAELRKVGRQLDKGALEIAALGALVVRKTAMDIERDAKIFAPVDTGALRNSISTTVEERGARTEAEIGPTVLYGGFVEWGTSRMAPKPYMGPATNRHEPAFLAAAEQLGAKAIGG